jgi:hypothetical protein
MAFNYTPVLEELYRKRNVINAGIQAIRLLAGIDAEKPEPSPDPTSEPPVLTVFPPFPVIDRPYSAQPSGPKTPKPRKKAKPEPETNSAPRRLEGLQAL